MEVIGTVDPNKPNIVKSSIIMVFDPSFDEDYGLEYAIGEIYGVLSKYIHEKDTLHIFFGISDRLNWQVFDKAKSLGWPRSTLHPIQIPNTPDMGVGERDKFISLATKYFGELIHTNPRRILLFRDNNVSDIGHILVDKCLSMRVPVISINSLGHMVDVNDADIDRTPKKYYRHPKNAAGGIRSEGQ